MSRLLRHFIGKGAQIKTTGKLEMVSELILNTQVGTHHLQLKKITQQLGGRILPPTSCMHLYECKDINNFKEELKGIL